MHTDPTLEPLDQLRFRGMAAALREQLAQPDIQQLDFMEQLGLLVDRQASMRESVRLRGRLRRAKLRQQACIEDLIKPDTGGRRRLLQSRQCGSV